jgi:hypothetical protein
MFPRTSFRETSAQNLQGKSETPGSRVKVEKANFSENAVSPKTVVSLNNAVKLPNLARTKYAEHLEQLKYHIGFISWKKWIEADFVSYKFKQAGKYNYKNTLLLFTTIPSFFDPRIIFKDLLSIRTFYDAVNSYQVSFRIRFGKTFRMLIRKQLHDHIH